MSTTSKSCYQRIVGARQSIYFSRPYSKCEPCYNQCHASDRHETMKETTMIDSTRSRKQQGLRQRVRRAIITTTMVNSSITTRRANRSFTPSGRRSLNSWLSVKGPYAITPNTSHISKGDERVYTNLPNNQRMASALRSERRSAVGFSAVSIHESSTSIIQATNKVNAV